MTISKGLILVTGATGQQGGAVTRHLLARGFKVRALVRDPASAKALALAERGVELVQGNLNNPVSLAAAVKGVAGVYSVQNPAAQGVVVEAQQGKALADAAQAEGVGHFIYSSVASADQNTGVPLFESKFEVEQHLRALGLPCTIVRPVFFMNNWGWSEAALKEGYFTQPLSAGTKLQQIAADDIGAFVAAAFDDPASWIGKTAELAGDEMSMTQLADVFTATRGAPVAYRQTPWADYEQRMGREYTLMLRFLEEKGYHADPAVLRSLVPGAKTLTAFLTK